MNSWDSVWKDAIAAAKAAVGSSVPKIEDYVQQVGAGHSDALESLAKARAQGIIDQATLEAELDNEAQVFRAELLALQAMGKAAAQRAANAFFDVLANAIKVGIAGLL